MPKYTPCIQTTSGLLHLDSCTTIAAAVQAREDYTRDIYDQKSDVYTKTKAEAKETLRLQDHKTMIKL